MKKYFYTFGSAGHFPFFGGWVEIHAASWKEAHGKFRSNFPDYTEGILNCSDYYSEQEFTKTGMLDGNLGSYCHQVIE